MVNIYQTNKEKYQATVKSLASKLQELSWYRLVAFVFSVFLIVLFASEGAIALVLIVALFGGLGFAALMKRYNKTSYQKNQATFLAEVNEQEIQRLQNNLSLLPSGQTFTKHDHPYVADLDVFGTHSLYRLINRATTESGRECLAEWLSEPATKEAIIARQEAVEELSPQLAWRQEFQASGMHFTNAKSDYRKLLDWLETPTQLLLHRNKYLIASIALAVLTTAALLYHFLYAYTSGFIVHTLPLIMMLIINTLFLRRVKSVAEAIINNTHQNVKILGGYQALILKIEAGEFSAKHLQQLRSVFTQGNYSAAQEINKIKRILGIAQLKGTNGMLSNQFYPVLNTFWLIDVYWILAAEKWKTANASHLRIWAKAVGEFETLSSLAGFSYSNPSYTFPKIKEGACTIHFGALGHPLLKPEGRICNDFNLKSSDNIVMITGSNMAGKSTFLRTVGVNIVLGLMGAPCCADTAELTAMQLFTSMRTQDNLEEGISSFNAELRKVEQLLKLIQQGEPVFFLLDEMFKGTNSKDRHRGGFSLIKQLQELNAFGMISTHDLDLADVAGKHNLVTNYSFNSEIQEGDMTFDYRLTPGLCKDFNASELMRRSGINVLTEFSFS
ncbi:MutS-related protein [Tunicatimonas sp.]|uniref:MutS-related protein n=1 Tax=Tunicatimonas sp. TaxID=1940096 RepID=UPI003C74EE67